MKTETITTAMVATILSTVLAMPAPGRAGESHDEDDDDHAETVPFLSAPAAVQRAFKQQLGKHVPGKLERETESSLVVWEAEFSADGVEQSLKVSGSGEILELEKSLDPDALPAVVRAAVTQKHPGAKLTKAEAVYLKGGASVSFYEVDLANAGKVQEIKVSVTGEIVK